MEKGGDGKGGGGRGVRRRPAACLVAPRPRPGPPLPPTPPQVWSVLTDLDALPDIVPNLEACERVPAPPGCAPRVRQRASSQCRFWRLEAEAVLALSAAPGPGARGS